VDKKEVVYMKLYKREAKRGKEKGRERSEKGEALSHSLYLSRSQSSRYLHPGKRERGKEREKRGRKKREYHQRKRGLRTDREKRMTL